MCVDGAGGVPPQAAGGVDVVAEAHFDGVEALSKSRFLQAKNVRGGGEADSPQRRADYKFGAGHGACGQKFERGGGI
jgi:hypothetical protein